MTEPETHQVTCCHLTKSTKNDVSDSVSDSLYFLWGTTSAFIKRKLSMTFNSSIVVQMQRSEIDYYYFR
jgi:hypothetical protein